MINIDRKIMDKNGYKEISHSLRQDLKKHLKFDFFMDFREIVCEEGESEVIISTTSENFDWLVGFVYGLGENLGMDSLINKYSKKYGSFAFRVDKIKNESFVDAEIGDLVVIENEYDNEGSVGIVTSINEQDGRKMFGCSHFVVAFKGTVYARHGASGAEIVISDEDYGGYYTGFSKKLTAEEAESIILKKIDKEYKKEKQELEDETNALKKSFKKNFNKIANKAVFKVFKNEELKFDRNFNGYFHVPNSLMSKFP